MLYSLSDIIRSDKSCSHNCRKFFNFYLLFCSFFAFIKGLSESIVSPIQVPHENIFTGSNVTFHKKLTILVKRFSHMMVHIFNTQITCGFDKRNSALMTHENIFFWIQKFDRGNGVRKLEFCNELFWVSPNFYESFLVRGQNPARLIVNTQASYIYFVLVTLTIPQAN